MLYLSMNGFMEKNRKYGKTFFVNKFYSENPKLIAKITKISAIDKDTMEKLENGAILIVFCDTACSMRIPAKSLPENIIFYAEGDSPGQKGEPVFSKHEGDYITIKISDTTAGRWIFGVKEKQNN